MTFIEERFEQSTMEQYEDNRLDNDILISVYEERKNVWPSGVYRIIDGEIRPIVAGMPFQDNISPGIRKMKKSFL